MRRRVQESHVLEPSEDGAKGSNSRHGLKVELAGHADGLEWHLELHEITVIKALPFLSAQRLPIARSKMCPRPPSSKGEQCLGNLDPHRGSRLSVKQAGLSTHCCTGETDSQSTCGFVSLHDERQSWFKPRPSSTQ